VISDNQFSPYTVGFVKRFDRPTPRTENS